MRLGRGGRNHGKISLQSIRVEDPVAQHSARIICSYESGINIGFPNHASISANNPKRTVMWSWGDVISRDVWAKYRVLNKQKSDLYAHKWHSRLKS